MELNKENYLKLKETGKYTRPQMAGIFNMPDWKLKKWIANNGMGAIKPVVKNKSVFKNRDCPKANYWAGFIAADGCVDTKGRLRFYLQLSDYQHLEKFASFVGSNHKINKDEKRNRCSIEFTCRSMVEDLLYWNIVPNKSISYTPPKGFFNSHFIRGLFDGDGTISESFSNVNSRTATLYAGLSCSYPCRDWFKSYCDNLGITIKQHERENIVTITMNTNKSIVFLDAIYSSSAENTRLTRKYNLYHNIVVLGNRKTR